MVVMISLSAFLVARAQPPPTATLDSLISTSCNGCTTLTASLSVKAGDIIVVQAAASPESVLSRGGGYIGLNSISSPGLTFQNRFNYTENPGSGDGSLVWERWALATTTGATSVSGQVNQSKTAWDIVAYSVTGINTTHPFDSNTMLAFGAWDFNDCNPTDGCAVHFSTSAANTFVVSGIAAEGCPTATAPSNGFTLISESSCNGWTEGAVAYTTYSSSQTQVSTGNWGLSPGESGLWYADALDVAGSSTTTTSLSTTSTTSSSTTSTSSTTTSSTTTTSTVTVTSTVTSTVVQTLQTQSCVVTFTENTQGSITGWTGACP